MDIDSLIAFVAVAETASFSLAGERLHLTQPAVSKRIGALEARLGARLFDRIGRRVLITEAGRTLLPRARRILAELDDCRRALDNLSGAIAGPLVLATSHHVGLHRLPPILRRFATRHPQVRLDMRFMDSEVACTEVLHGEVELAIVTLPDAPPAALTLTPLWRDVLVLVTNHVHPLAKQRRVSPQQLMDYPAILPGAGTFTRRVIDRLFEPLGLEPPVAFSTNYLETIKMMVSVGMGWSLLPQIMVDGSLAALELAGGCPGRRLGVVTHARQTPSNAARAMLELLACEEPGDGIAAPWRGY